MDGFAVDLALKVISFVFLGSSIVFHALVVQMTQQTRPSPFEHDKLAKLATKLLKNKQNSAQSRPQPCVFAGNQLRRIDLQNQSDKGDPGISLHRSSRQKTRCHGGKLWLPLLVSFLRKRTCRSPTWFGLD